MAPNKPREPSVEHTEEHEEFLDKLEKYHEERGTTLDREPKIGSRHLDLLKLYNRVIEEGGYDKVSDTKGNKLAWRRLAGEFLPGSPNLTTQAFLVKSAYYKNLAAYEITHIHKRDPPPKEILEDVSAKGGDLLTRTVENYLRPSSREADRLGNGDDLSGDSDSEDNRTPKEDKGDGEEPGSTGGRITRALRHAPPQRVLFQPEVSGRQTRQSTGAMNSPQPNGMYNTSGAAATIANYEPRNAAPSQVKPVITPANNPDHFRNLRNKFIANRQSRSRSYKGMMLPGTGFMGPNIYIRALLALQSNSPQEEAYALHHLVKISHERGDKYRFDQFPGLAEALMIKVIAVASLFYDIKWGVSYLEEDMEKGAHILNGLSGTPDLLQRIQSLKPLDFQDTLLPEDSTTTLGLVNEAGLILRNMVLLRENAYYVSTIPLIKDLIVIVLNLPNHPTVVELQHYALEYCEQLTRFWILQSHDPLYQSLLAQVISEDRGKIITSLRSIGRLAMDLEPVNKPTDVPAKTLQLICDWLLVEDEELRIACLDFLYLFTGFKDNVEILLNEVNVENVVNQLVRLLLYNAVAFEERRNHQKTSKASQLAESAPKLSSSIVETLVTLDEPERSSQWLRTCFEDDPTGEITQIALWSSYNAAFSNLMTASSDNKPLMPAKDFITNVSTTFSGASAQVLQVPGAQSKYTIRGIRPRAVPVDPQTKKQYMRCQWHSPSLLNGHTDSKHSIPKLECGEFASGARAMWEHIVSVHLKVPREPETGKWLLEQKPDINMTNGDAVSNTPASRYFCHWGGCTHYGLKGSESAYEVGQHVKTHLPDTSALHSVHAKHNRSLSNSNLSASVQSNQQIFQPQFGMPVGLGGLGMGGRNHGYGHAPAVAPPQAPTQIRYQLTQTDERNDAAGLPLAAVLVLRNLARQMGKLDPPKLKKEGDEDHEHDDGRRASGASKRPRLSSDAKLDDHLEKESEVTWVRKVFSPVKEQLYFVLAHNLTLKDYLTGLFKAIATGGG